MLEAVRTFADFTADNDPYGEHDFGAVEIDSRRCFWKIDLYEKTVVKGSAVNGSLSTTPRTFLLDRRTRHVAIGTVDAAIALLGLHLQPALRADVYILACIGWHRFCGPIAALWARDC